MFLIEEGLGRSLCYWKTCSGDRVLRFEAEGYGGRPLLSIVEFCYFMGFWFDLSLKALF